MLPTLAGCVSEEEKATALRSQYKATLSGFTVVQEPQAAAAGTAVTVEQDVVLDVAVNRDAGDAADTAAVGIGDDGLPGLTLDVTQLDVSGGPGGAGREKRRWRVWVETAGLAPGAEAAERIALEDVDYRPGDRFEVEVRGEVPPAQRGEYREFSGGSSGS